MLELRGLTVAYGGVEVLHGVDLSLGGGEVVGVVGPNGAGKSSLLRAICGLTRSRAGEINFEGRSLRGLAPEEIARLGIALVPEGRQIFGTLTVAENLRLAAQGDGGETMEQVLERLPILRKRAGQRAARLSGGEQQQLAVGRALLRRPRLLILDEPSLGLAPKMIDVIYGLLEELRSEGTTMLLVEQNAARTIDFCQRSMVLAGGKVRASGRREELQRNPEVLRAYMGRQL
ncbi:MAG TPA: ATP-binding cassette domain-containing protein [Solirubrobacterales bacterium]|nr:ATP-binding cassette domain-containing protein [Solirubrobacterales bacterium]